VRRICLAAHCVRTAALLNRSTWTMPSSSPVDRDQPTLRRIEILADLSEDALRVLSRQCAWRTYAPKQRVISRHARDRHVYLIVSGKVRVSVYAANGREVAYRDVGAGRCFGEIAAIDEGPRSANVEALEGSVIAVVPNPVFWSLLQDYPGVMVKVARMLTATIRSLSERLFELSTLGIQNRVHAEVLRLAREVGIERNTATIDPTPRHDEIAARISTNREQVTKELSAMQRRGLIVKSRRALIVPDVARLEQLVLEVAGGS